MGTTGIFSAAHSLACEQQYTMLKVSTMQEQHQASKKLVFINNLYCPLNQLVAKFSYNVSFQSNLAMRYSIQSLIRDLVDNKRSYTNLNQFILFFPKHHISITGSSSYCLLLHTMSGQWPEILFYSFEYFCMRKMQHPKLNEVNLLTSSMPGSLMPGVPASLINAIASPS